MLSSNKVKFSELGRPSESGRPSAISAKFWTSTMSGSGSGGRMPPPPLRGRRWRLLVYSSSRLKKQAAQPALANGLKAGLDNPTLQYRQIPVLSALRAAALPLSTHQPVHQAPSARLRNSASLRRSAAPTAFGHRSSHNEVCRSHLLRRHALLVLTVLLIVLVPISSRNITQWVLALGLVWGPVF